MTVFGPRRASVSDLDARPDGTLVIALNDRVRFARSHGAALFISIHADALPKKEGQAEGATVYTLSEHASDAEAARLADDENKADVIAGVDLTAEPDDVANILVDLAYGFADPRIRRG